MPGLEFPVGSQFAYRGTSYVLLAMVVAIILGQSFADFLNANIFNPLGTKNSVAYDASRPARQTLAHRYSRRRISSNAGMTMLTVGDGGLFPTLDDLFLWDQVLNTERLVSKATLELAFTGMTNDRTPVGYEFGWYTNVFPLPEHCRARRGADLRHVAHGGGCVA